MTSLCSNMSSKVSYWARNGGGHLGVTVFATGGGGTRKFFPIFCNFSAFWREQSPVANTLTPKCPPPIACPVRHDFFQKIFMG